MPKITVSSLIEGDILAKDLIINDVVLFMAGTVLVNKIIDIITDLEVESIYVEGREGKHLTSLDEINNNINERFSYVEDNPFMMSLKNHVKSIILTARMKR